MHLHTALVLALTPACAAIVATETWKPNVVAWYSSADEYVAGFPPEAVDFDMVFHFSCRRSRDLFLRDAVSCRRVSSSRPLQPRRPGHTLNKDA